MPTFDPDLSHPARAALAAEVHSRPFLKLQGPALVSHLALLPTESGNELDGLWASLCAELGQEAPAPGLRHAQLSMPGLQLKWEQHTEFATLTLVSTPEPAPSYCAAFAQAPRHRLPAGWLARLRASVLVAADVLLLRASEDGAALQAALRDCFGAQVMLVGGRVMQGGELWTDFKLNAEGISRFVLRDIDMREQQAGRLVQRVLEVETYRMMALLGFPAARTCTAELSAMERELGALTDAMVGEGEQALLLDQITRLAARTEQLAVQYGFRFAASAAYFRLVQARIEELRELRIEGVPTVGEFMERRLAPAMDTCASTAARLASLGQRIDRCNDLLRTRVGVIQEQQNRRILQSLNARAAQQLYLQQAVEGLSVAAITYYMVGVAAYLAKGLKSLGVAVNVDLLSGAAVPLAAGACWWMLRRLHHRMPGGHNANSLSHGTGP